MKTKTMTKTTLILFTALIVILIAVAGACWLIMVKMPGASWSGPLPPLTARQSQLAASLRHDIDTLANTIGRRDLAHYENLKKAANYITTELSTTGLHVDTLDFTVDGYTFTDIIAEKRGTTEPNQIIIIGAHYDSADGTPGANDNASGVAAMLALARAAAHKNFSRTVRFVAFPLEETGGGGSLAYARHCFDTHQNIVAMFSIETIGYFRDEKDTQQYPPPLSLFYPSTGNFIAFVGNMDSRSLVRRSVTLFRSHAAFPSQGAALPARIADITRSDHASFWQYHYPALMITDTAPFRYPWYHHPDDTPDKIDYNRLARVVDGLEKTFDDLAGIAP